MSKLSWTQYWALMAMAAATKSKDSTQVGAILIGADNDIRMTAFNGPPKGVEDLPERFERPAKYLYASHAEQNLIAFAARAGVQTLGCTVVVTHYPCAGCAKSLIQAGIKRVFVGDGKTSMPTEEFKAASIMFDEAGIICEAIGAE